MRASTPPPDAGARLARVLAWMARQDFEDLNESGLLRDVEEIVVDSHRRLSEGKGRPWSRPAAYHWLRYEDPNPVGRLVDGVRRLRTRGAKFDAKAVDKACVKASKTGYLN
jgi:hypothetical protein